MKQDKNIKLLLNIKQEISVKLQRSWPGFYEMKGHIRMQIIQINTYFNSNELVDILFFILLFIHFVYFVC